MVSDKEILEAYKFLAQAEGVFVEPASAASVAGLFKLKRQGYFKRTISQVKIICILTGNGLKDPQTSLKAVKPPKVVEPTTEAVAKQANIL